MKTVKMLIFSLITMMSAVSGLYAYAEFEHEIKVNRLHDDISQLIEKCDCMDKNEGTREFQKVQNRYDAIMKLSQESFLWMTDEEQKALRKNIFVKKDTQGRTLAMIAAEKAGLLLEEDKSKGKSLCEYFAEQIREMEAADAQNKGSR